MSVAVRRGVYGKLAGDTTLNAMLGTPAPGYAKSIYYQFAPQKAGFPYLILNKQASTPRYAMSALAMDNDVWLVKAVDRSDTADPADSIASRVLALLNDAALSISGKSTLYLRRESDLDYSQEVDGVNYRHAGSLYRLVYA